MGRIRAVESGCHETNPLLMDTSRLTAQKPLTPIRERAYEHLKSAILGGKYKPGHRLTEEALARELGISRTPVREALYKLESEGLITPLETRGFVTASDSKEEVEEIFEIRGVLEGYALRLVAADIDDETLEALGGIVDKASHALETNDMETVFRCNTEFHDRLQAMVAHKQRLHGMIVHLRRYILRYRRSTLMHPDGGRRTAEGHQKIVMALRLRDPDLCERVMREHIQEAEKDALQRLFETQQRELEQQQESS